MGHGNFLEESCGGNIRQFFKLPQLAKSMVSPALLLTPAIIIVVIIIRFRRIVSGNKVSRTRVIGSSALAVVFSFLAVYSSFEVGISTNYLYAYAGLLVGSAYASHKIVKKSLKVWKADDGLVYVKGGAIPYLIWISSLATRFVLGYLFLGSAMLSSFGSQKILGGSALEATLAVDLIMMIGIGAVIGRNTQVLSKLKDFQSK